MHYAGGSRLNSPRPFVSRRFNSQYRRRLCGPGYLLRATVERAKAALSLSVFSLVDDPEGRVPSRRNKVRAHVTVIREYLDEKPAQHRLAIDTVSSRSFSCLFTKTPPRAEILQNIRMQNRIGIPLSQPRGIWLIWNIPRDKYLIRSTSVRTNSSHLTDSGKVARSVFETRK